MRGLAHRSSVASTAYEDVLAYLGANIRRRRKRLGWTQAEAAEEAELELRYYQRIERGLASPSLRVLVDIAEVLDCEPAALLRPCKISPRPTGRPPKRRR